MCAFFTASMPAQGMIVAVYLKSDLTLSTRELSAMLNMCNAKAFKYTANIGHKYNCILLSTLRISELYKSESSI